MGKEIITLGDTEIKKLKFCHCNNLILLEDVDIDKTQMSSMLSSSEKKIINILWVIKMIMIIKLNHYTYCFQKQVLM